MGQRVKTPQTPMISLFSKNESLTLIGRGAVCSHRRILGGQDCPASGVVGDSMHLRERLS